MANFIESAFNDAKEAIYNVIEPGLSFRPVADRLSPPQLGLHILSKAILEGAIKEMVHLPSKR